MGVLITLVSAGLATAVAVPHFASRASTPAESNLAASLATMRRAIEAYHVTHDERYPVTFSVQFTHPTDPSGMPGTALPAALPAGFPRNALNGLSVVKDVVTLPAEADGSSGWIYCLASGEVRANVRGRSAAGQRYFDY